MLSIRENITLSTLTTFGIGGDARYVLDVQSETDIREALEWARSRTLPYQILAGGSNVLAPDEGFPGVVIRLVEGASEWHDSELIAEAGCDLFGLIQTGGERGCGGWESMSGIPGSLGGAVRGNAGAFGTEIKDVLLSASAFNTETGEAKEFQNADCVFQYRDSFFKSHPSWIITKAIIRLEKKDRLEITQAITGTIQEREKRHLQNVRAAGSYFTNPVAPTDVVQMFEKEKNVQSKGGRVPAGWLIEMAGFRGFRHGNAEASQQHADYLKNNGGATSREVTELADMIRAAVKTKFNVSLKEEAVVW